MASNNADHAHGLQERMQNLRVSDESEAPNAQIQDETSHANVPVPAQEPSSDESGREQTDDTQGERSCIVEPLSKPVRVGYNVHNVDSSGQSTWIPAVDASVDVTLCRFESGRLIKETHSSRSVSFVAISHVWGEARWRSVEGVEGDVLVSNDKAKFITDVLPGLMGEDWFWMDVLCIDQRSKAARIAVTQHIPTIFRSASKALVVRTDGGYQKCCAEQWRAVWRGHSRYEAQMKMFEHMRDHHRDDDCDEGVLTRLWPYQEILLSNTVQFVRCESVPGTSDPQPKKINKLPEVAISDSLFSTAIVWTSYGEDDGDDYSDLYYTDFLDAFFALGTVERTDARGITQFPFAQEFQLNMNNKRRTTKARDFILAIMPQFSFYTVPKDAKEMTFSGLYFDCIRQLSRIGHVMAPLIIRRTINFIESNTCIWESEIPEPASLGDFIKLLNGPRIGYAPRIMVSLYSASVRLVSDLHEMQHVVRSDADAELLSLARGIVAVHLVVRQIALSPQLFKLATGDLMHNVRSEPGDRASSQECFIDAVRTLVAIARLSEQGLGGEAIAAHSNYVLVTYLKLESDREALLTLTAMIACNIGLSAFDWVLEHMQPLKVVLPVPGEKDHSALALVSRTFSLDKRFFLTEGGTFSFRMGGADIFKRWALFTTEHLEEGELEMCLFPLEMRFREWDDGHEYVPGPVGLMAAVN